MQTLDTADIQGIIISGYLHLVFSCYLFLKCESPPQAKQWLAQIAGDITTAKQPGEKPKSAINIAFSYIGLKTLGLPDKSICTFPEEFKEGITNPSRSRRLGDNGSSDPVHWDIGGVTEDRALKDPIHILLILQAPEKDVLAALRTKYETEAAGYGVRRIHCEEGYRRIRDHKEHFGFRDGISQPNIEGSPKDPDDTGIPVKTGEFILGYPNSYGSLPPTLTVAAASDLKNHRPPLPQVDGNSNLLDLGRNGSFLVFRKLHQDVAGFRKFFQDRFPDPKEQKLTMAKAVGRWPSGTPLVLSPGRDSHMSNADLERNDFG